MNTKQLVATLRPLFAELKKIQWAIGDVADELGVGLGTLLEYRRMASTFAKSERVASASFTAHVAAAAAKDPAKVMAEAKVAADRHGERTVSIATVREVAAKPKHQKPAPPQPYRAPRTPHLDVITFGSRANDNLRQLCKSMVGADRTDVSDDDLDVLEGYLKRCDEHISWIRSWMKGDLVDQTAEFLRSN